MCLSCSYYDGYCDTECLTAHQDAEHKPRLLPCPFCGIVGVHKCEGEWQVDNCQHEHYKSLGTVPAKTKIIYSCGNEGCDPHRVVESIPQQARRLCLTCGDAFTVTAEVGFTFKELGIEVTRETSL